MRQGSAPNFCPPTEEGITLTFQDEKGELVELEFLGLILHEGRRYGFFFPVTEDTPACSSGEIIPLEVTELDEDGQPAAFELVEDEAIAREVYEDFREAAKDLYDFEYAFGHMRKAGVFSREHARLSPPATARAASIPRGCRSRLRVPRR